MNPVELDTHRAAHTEREGRPEEERRAHLWFLESMARINRAMQRTNDVEAMMSGVLEETLAIFGCDRAWLVYPCDPEAVTCRAVREHTRPEYPGAFALGEEFPMDAQSAEVLRRVLHGPGAVTDLSVPPEIRERFAIESMIAIAVRPKGDRPYLFGLHQCSQARVWTAAEGRLLEEVARRLEDALTSVLAHRNLLASEEELRQSKAYLAEAQKLSQTGSWAWSPEGNITYWSEECYRVLGFDPQDGLPRSEEFFQRIHPDDLPAFSELAWTAVRTNAQLETDYRIVRPDGSVRVIHVVGGPVLSEAGDLVVFVGTVIDITDRKRAEEEHREHLWFLESMDRINRAMQRSNDMEGMMSGVLEETLAIFGSDRARLVYPCDPDAAATRVVMEHSRPEHPGVFALGEEVPMDLHAAQFVRRVLDSPGAAVDLNIAPEIRERFRVQSAIAIAVHPKGDRPYLFGMHQCTHARTWTAAERRLFEEIARRLEDALTSVLAHRNLLASEEALQLLSRDLQESKAKLEEAQRLTHVGYWEWDLSTGRVTWSDENYRIYGLQPQERPMDIAAVQEMIHPEDWQRGMDEAVGGDRFSVECRVLRPAGEMRIAIVEGDVKRDASGKPYRMFGTTQDITDRKRVEEELRRSRAYLAEAQKVSHTGSWAWNPASNEVLYWSEECYRILGHDPAEGIPTFEQLMDDVHPEDRSPIAYSLGQAIKARSGWQEEYRLVNFAGGPRTVHAIAHPVLDGAGRVIEYVGTVMDITDQKRAEEERRQHVWFLESMDRINRAMQRTNDVEGTTSGVLEEAIAIFDCDRAWLVYPCDPDSPTVRAVMEHTSPEYPGAFAQGEELPMDGLGSEVLRSVLLAPGAVDNLVIPPAIRQRFSIRSMIAIAVRPRGDQPYLFGLTQCSRPRTWTAAERRLFEEIARRLEDALTSVLSHRNLLVSQEELRTSEQRFRTFADQATDAFFLFDDQSIVCDVNRHACESLGYTREELIGMHVGQFTVEFIPETVKQKTEDGWMQLRVHGHTTATTLRRRKDGSTFPVEVRVRSFTRGGRTWALALANDITERKRREQRQLAQYRVTQILSERNSLEEAVPRILRAMCEALEWEFGALWRADAQAGLLRCLDAWPPGTDFEREARQCTFMPGVGLPGKVWATGSAVCVRDQELDPTPPCHEFAARHGIHASLGFPIRTRAGVLAVMQFFSPKVRDAEAELLQMTSAIGFQLGEFIERSRAEEALRAARSELAHVTRVMSMGELTASIAHEVNQPLGAMVTSAASAMRWLAAHPPNLERASLALARIAVDGERASAVIDRMRTLVKRQEPGRESIDVNETILSVTALMRDEMERAGVAHAVRLADNLPRVTSDRVLLQQVILNLVLNAIDAMRGVEDRARVLRIESRLDKQDEVRIAVRDTGRGLPPDARLFEAFYTTKERGLGMGLSISRSIVEAHGGRMAARPNEPYGAIFEFSLPVKQA